MTSEPWRHALGLIRHRPIPFAMSFAGYLAYYGIGLVPGFIVRSIFDTLTGHSAPTLSVWALICLILAVELARIAALFVGQVIYSAFAYGSEALLRSNALNWLVNAPGPQELAGSTGEAIGRLRDEPPTLVTFAGLFLMSPQLPVGLASIAILTSINVRLALVVIAPLAVAVAATYILTRSIQQRRRAARATAAAVGAFVGETFSAVQAIKLAGAEAQVVDHLAQLGEARARAALGDQLVTVGLASLNASLAAFGTALVLFFAAKDMKLEAFSVGDFVLFADYVALAAISPVILGQMLALERQSRVSIDRLRGLIEGAPPLQLVAQRPGEPSAVLDPINDRSDRLETMTVCGLTRRYPGTGGGVSDFNLTVKRGDLIILTGPVGSGKTTVLRAVLGLTARDAGEVCWNGRRVEDPSTFLTPPRCAYTAQSPRLFSDTLLDNILMGRAVDPTTVSEALHLAMLELDIDCFAQGLETQAGARGAMLSGGQLQRVAAARMFLRQADLLVFDDLSSALDVETERLLWQRLGATTTHTCIAVSQRREAMKRATEVILLDDGHIVARGDVETLLKSSTLFRQIWGHDAH